MLRKAKLGIVATAALAIALLGSQGVSAQATPDSSASTPKQVRKAERRAARAKNSAELRELEKNGYKPGGEEPNYPQDIQNAQRKASAQKAGQPAPASAP